MNRAKGTQASTSEARSVNRLASSPAPMPLAVGRTACLALPFALVLLQGCATAPPAGSAAALAPGTATSVGKQPGKPGESATVKAGPSVAPQVQAELDSAMALVRAEQYDGAIEAFRKIAAALPHNAIPTINLALVYKKLDKPELAEAQLKEALAIEPDNPVAGNELALLYRKTGRFAEARAVYERMLATYPHFAMAHKNLGVLCDLYMKDYPCAIDHYKTYATSAPNDKSVQIWIADLQKRTGTKEAQ